MAIGDKNSSAADIDRSEEMMSLATYVICVTKQATVPSDN